MASGTDTAKHGEAPSSPQPSLNGGTEGNSAPSAASPTSSAKASPAARFAFVDGLRGIAAISIVIFHVWLYEPAPFPTLEHTPWLLEEAFRRTRGGVQILLVISGFVIAYTLRRTWFSIGEMFSFLLRRLVRLAPAYWLAIAFVILVDAFCHMMGDLPRPFEDRLSVPRVVAHMTFLQDVAGHQAFSAGIWTLCIEMQFYFVAVLTWGLAQRLFPRPNKDDPQPSALSLLVLFAPAAVFSLVYWRPLESTEPYVIHFLWMFFLGMATWWTLDGVFPKWAYAIIILIAEAELMINSEWWFQNTTSLETALLIYLGGRLNQLHRWLSGPTLQYLGRISYSLYLIHFPVSHLVVSLGWKWCQDDPSPLIATFILLSAVLLSILAGQVLYVLVEEPSARLSARLKKASSTPAPGLAPGV
jgi:peptidoglycan/LPS O-acetylase OafA/YrhL